MYVCLYVGGIQASCQTWASMSCRAMFKQSSDRHGNSAPALKATQTIVYVWGHNTYISVLSGETLFWDANSVEYALLCTRRTLRLVGNACSPHGCLLRWSDRLWHLAETLDKHQVEYFLNKFHCWLIVTATNRKTDSSPILLPLLTPILPLTMLLLLLLQHKFHQYHQLRR